MTSSSSCDIRRNLIPDAPSSDSQLPGATLGGSEPVLGGLGADERGGRTPLSVCVLGGLGADERGGRTPLRLSLIHI